LPYDKTEVTQSIEVKEAAPPIPWWIFALLGGVGGIFIIGGVILYEEDRKRRLWELMKR
jgi:hypothetical protein